MNNTGILNSQSHFNRSRRGAGLDMKIEYRGKITRAEVEAREHLTQALLNKAMFHCMPQVRILELQKQKLMLKILKAGL